MSQTVPFRREIAREDTWDTESIFPNDSTWEAELTSIGEQLASLARFRGHLGDSATVLADWCSASETIEGRLGKVVLYANMKYTVDTGDQAAAGLNDRARGLAARAAATVAFAEPELLAIGFDRLRAWMQSEPRLAIYNHYVDRLETRAAHGAPAGVRGEDETGGEEEPGGKPAHQG